MSSPSDLELPLSSTEEQGESEDPVSVALLDDLSELIFIIRLFAFLELGLTENRRLFEFLSLINASNEYLSSRLSVVAFIKFDGKETSSCVLNLESVVLILRLIF
jgi:hypothetical protein